ncbi:hypothetical protein BDZ91DRAFT_660978, partial [Kalaharituber pfeilii]
MEKALGRFALVAHKCWIEDEERARSLRRRRTSKFSGYSRDEDEDEEPEEEEVGVAIGATVDDYTVLFAFRSYHKHLNAIQGYPSTVAKEIERGQVYRQYLRFLSALLASDFYARFGPSRQGSRGTMRSYPSSLAGGVRQSTNTIGVVGGGVVGGIGITKDELKDEIRSIQGIYENYFTQTTSFPKADEVHLEVLEWVDMVMQNWKRMGATVEDAATVKDILYRAAGKTFHSPRILRHLFTTLTAVGNFKEALLSFNTYIELVNRAQERISKGGAEKDLDDDSTIIVTAVEGIRVICKYLNNGKRALEVAELLEQWLEDWGPEILAAAWRGIGLARSYWARQTVDAAKRPEIQHSAERAFRKALEHDEEDVEALYGLSMALAETRNIDEAVENIKQALMVLSHLKAEGEEQAEGPDEEEVIDREYRRLAVPFWHHLALLLSANEEFEGALRVCDAAFEELGGEESLRRANMGPDEKENILEVKMTQLALIELMDGPDAAISMADELLRLYPTLFYASNLEGQIKKVEEVRQQQVQEQLKALDLSEKPSRLRPMSRYSRLGRSHHKKQDSAVASVLSGSTVRPTTSGSTVTGRPKSSHAVNAPQIQVTDNGGTVKSLTGSPTGGENAKLQKRVGRANSVSGGTIRRRKSLGSVKSTTSSQGQVPGGPAIQTDTRKVRRSPSLGSAVPGARSHPPVPPLPPSAPQTPTAARTHIFHMHKHVKGPNGGVQSTDAITGGADDMLSTAGVPLGEPAAATAPPPPQKSISRRTNRLFPLSSRLREPCLPEETERTKFLSCLRRVWLLVAGLYRRGGFFDDALQAIDEAAQIKTTSEGGDADVAAE